MLLAKLARPAHQLLTSPGPSKELSRHGSKSQATNQYLVIAQSVASKGHRIKINHMRRSTVWLLYLYVLLNFCASLGHATVLSTFDGGHQTTNNLKLCF
jgi:hypothetical protein